MPRSAHRTAKTKDRNQQGSKTPVSCCCAVPCFNAHLFYISQAERNELEKRFGDVTNMSDPTTLTPAEEDSGDDSDQDSDNEENM